MRMRPQRRARAEAPGGAWYCAWDMLTSVQEVGFRRTRELGFIGICEDEARFVELLAVFIGDFPDLHEEPHPALDPDPERGYPAGQRRAADLRSEGHRGLIYPSIRHPGGRCFVAFDPGIILMSARGRGGVYGCGGQGKA